MARFIDELKRTHRCGELRASDIGKEVVLFGWVQSRRDFGGLVFVDLRDRDGLTQVVFDPEAGPEAHAMADGMRSEWVIGIRGAVRSRGEQFSKKEGKVVSTINPKIATGEIEVIVHEATVFNRAETPPFEVNDDIDTREEIRLQYRLHRPAPRAPPALAQATPRDQPHCAQLPLGPGLPRARDALPGQVHARRRA